MTHEEPRSELSIFLLMAIWMLRSASAGIIMIIYPYIILKVLNIGVIFLGLIYSAAAISTALSALLFGHITDRFGRKPALIIASSLLPISTSILLLRMDAASAFIAAILGGMSVSGSMAGGGIGSAINPVINAVIADLTTKKKRTFYIGLLSFLGNIAGTLGLLVGGMLDYWNELLLSTVLTLIALSISLIIWVPSIRSHGIKLVHYKVIGKFSITGMLNGVSQGLVTPFFIPFFILIYGISREDMSIFASLSSLFATISFLYAYKLERVFGFLRSVVITRGMTVILMVLLPLIRILPVSLAIYLLYPALRVMPNPIIRSAMMDMVYPEERGRISGYNQASRVGVSSIGTAVAGTFLGSSLLFVPFLSYSLVMLTNIYLYLRFFKDYKTPWE